MTGHDDPGRRWHLPRWLRTDRSLALGLLVLILAVRISDPFPVELARLKVFDLYQTLKPRKLAVRPVAIVDIDEESLRGVGQWPWPRVVIAKLVDRLTAARAVVIGFDMAFPEPDRMSPWRIAESVSAYDPAMAEQLRRLPDSDAILAAALKRSRVVLGQFAYERDVAGAGAVPAEPTPLGEIGGDPRPFLPIHLGLVRNIPQLEDAAAGRGIISLLPESDGVVRRVPAVVRVGDKVFPALSIEMLRVATGQSAYGIRTLPQGISDIVIAGTRVPTDSRGRIWVYFAAPDHSRYVSAGKILAGDSLSPDLARRLAGKLVLIGTSAAGLRDLRPTPIEARLPGVEVHANLIETVLGQSYLKRPPEALGIEITAALLAGLLMVILVPLVGPIWTFPLFLAVSAALAGTSYYLFAQERVLIDAAFAIAAAFLTYILLTYTNYSREAAERRRVRDAFGHYMSPALVEQLAQHPEQLRLGGETRDMTILFCDIRGFTGICEDLDAAGVTRMLNRFLTPMTDIILARKGTVDKYMGDAIMAFWNAPLDVPDHAQAAGRAAFDMLKRLRDLNDELRTEAEAEGRQHKLLRIGIGINTGPCMVGNMGSEQRFDYSVLGDDVNLASRLEGISKLYGVPIVISDRTLSAMQGFSSLELDVVRVKGKQLPVKIHALFSRRMLDTVPEFDKLAKVHGELLAAYRVQDWENALRLIAACREIAPGGGVEHLYDLYERRVKEYVLSSPGADWDGVYAATSK